MSDLSSATPSRHDDDAFAPSRPGHPPLPDLHSTAPFLLARASRTLNRYLQPARDRYGLYEGRDLILIEIERLGERATPARLCETLWLTPASLSTVLRRTLAAGYLHRFPNPEDGRSSRLALTPTGRVCSSLMVDAWLAADQLLLARLGPSAFSDLRQLLGQAITALESARRAERRHYFPEAGRLPHSTGRGG